MYTILIVDDEEIIRRGLSNTIDWTSMGFTVLNAVENGALALKEIECNRPDVVLTDIKMPVMDGLTLLRKVRKEYPDIKVVLLSRHEDFEFAKTGMQLGAEGYILKFSIEENILEVFPKLYSELKDEQNRKEKLEELLAERKNLLYRNFFRRVIEGGINDAAVNRLIEREQDINLQDGLFCVTCLYVESENNHQEMSIEKKKLSMEWLLEMAEANSHAEDTNILFSHSHELIAVHYSNRSSQDQLYRMVLSWSKRFRQKLIQDSKQRSELAISIGVGSVSAGWNSIYSSYVQARKASFFKIVDNPIPIQEWETIKNKREKIRILSSIERKELVSSSLWGDKERLEQKLNYFFENLKSTAPVEQTEDVRSLLIEMFGVLYNRLRELNIELNGILIEESELFKKIYSLHNFSELEHWTRKVLLTIAEHMNDTRNLPAKRNIKKAAQYVSAYYGEKISMEKMANYACISPSHFSVLFKKHIGKTFTEYLLTVRMEAAKEMLLRELKVKDISWNVGYEDTNHFRKMFKKYFGVPPSEVQRTE